LHDQRRYFGAIFLLLFRDEFLLGASLSLTLLGQLFRARYLF
jgi:hypothetical protein